jgi:hypothetical protein
MAKTKIAARYHIIEKSNVAGSVMCSAQLLGPIGRNCSDDTQGLLMHAIVHAADIQDRDGGALLMATLASILFS